MLSLTLRTTTLVVTSAIFSSCLFTLIELSEVVGLHLLQFRNMLLMLLSIVLDLLQRALVCGVFRPLAHLSHKVKCTLARLLHVTGGSPEILTHGTSIILGSY